MGGHTRDGQRATADADRDQSLAELLALAAERFQHGEPIGPLTPDGDSDAEALHELLPTVQNLFALRDLTAGPARQVGQIGDFRVIRELGRGGMGVVYEAEQVGLRRRVALKVMSATGLPDDRHRQRFEMESRAAAGLRHPHIVPVYSAGHDGGLLFYAMQLIDGRTLADAIARAGEPDASTPPAHTPEHHRFAARLVAEAAGALEYAHQMGVVHRDVKPANLMLDRQGWLWVTDFGLAATPQAGGLTATGDRVGTIRYMSPEQAAGRRGLIDPRTDVYSLGLTLYELLTLRPAFGGDLDDLVRRLAAGRPPRWGPAPGVPADLISVVQKAAEPDPADRYQTAQEMADDLERFLAGQPVRARPPGLAKKAWRWAGHNRLKLALTAVAAASLAAAASASWWVTRQALANERAARAEEKARIRESHAIVQSTLLRVAGDREIREPAFERLREEFIAKGTRYLERFVEDHGDDPAFEPELACGVAQLAEMRRAQRRPAEAVRLYREAAERYDRLVARSAEPHRSAYRRHAEQVHQAIADCQAEDPGR